MTIFKQCPMCNQKWETREEFLEDQHTVLIGYQANFKMLEKGLFLFTHTVLQCGSTIGIYASEFLDLYNGPRYPDTRALTPGCPQYCIHEKQLQRCDVLCECAFVREVADIISKKNY